MKQVRAPKKAIAKKSGAKGRVRVDRNSLAQTYQEICDLRRRLKLAAAPSSTRRK